MEWSVVNSLTLNHSKCMYMILSCKRKQTEPPTPLLLDGQPLAQVTSFKYLGVILTNNLSLSEHVNSVCTRATKLLGLIFRAPLPELLSMYLLVSKFKLSTSIDMHLN